MAWPLGGLAGQLKTDSGTGARADALPCLVPCLASPAFSTPSALAKNRTRQQKGLRDRNSPTCTLSQNGYGDICSQVPELRSSSSGFLPFQYCCVLVSLSAIFAGSLFGFPSGIIR